MAFSLIALFNLVVLVLYRSILSGVPFGPTLLAGGALLQIVVLLAAAYGLATGRSWAMSVATPMLVFVIGSGLLSLVIALVRSSVDIPVGVLLAGWALAAPATRPAGRATPGGLALLAALALAIAWPYAMAVALQPGGALIAGPSDLQLSATVSEACLQPGGPPPAAAPETVDLTAAWSWIRGDALATGTDTLTVEWRTIRGDEVAGYSLVSVQPLAAGLTETNRTTGVSPGVIIFGNDLGRRQFQPGEVSVTFQRPGSLPAGHGSLEVRLKYAHGPADVYGPDTGSLWTVTRPMRCEW